MLNGVPYQTREKRRTRFNLPLHMIWDVRRDHLEGDMTPLVVMPSSLVGEAKGSLEWSFTPMPAGIMMLRKREEKNQKNINAQRNLREAQKVWRFLLY